jgi:hypothetical protein
VNVQSAEITFPKENDKNVFPKEITLMTSTSNIRTSFLQNGVFCQKKKVLINYTSIQVIEEYTLNLAENINYFVNIVI